MQSIVVGGEIKRIGVGKVMGSNKDVILDRNKVFMGMRSVWRGKESGILLKFECCLIYLNLMLLVEIFIKCFLLGKLNEDKIYCIKNVVE